MGFDAGAVLTLVLSICAAASSIPLSEAQSFGFTCNSAGAVCNGLVGYVSPNATTLSQIKTLFGVKNLRNILGANNLALTTNPSNQPVAANQTINIPFQCLCTNGSGVARNRRPIYKVVSGDFLYHIAAEVFSGLVTYQQIQAANGIANASKIEIGQDLWIPLPCSCDSLNGERVVHYGHVVQPGSTVAQIAQQYNTSADVLLSLNIGLSKGLLAGAVLDVPLKACTSLVGNNSWDYPLLVSNGTYAFTAGNCVKCTCDAANNWTLQCEPSLVKSSLWSTCPSMQCEGAESLIIGNTTMSSCNRSTCAYAGYANQTIFATLSTESTCLSSGKNNAAGFRLQGWSWTFLLISFHLVVLCLHFIK